MESEIREIVLRIDDVMSRINNVDLELAESLLELSKISEKLAFKIKGQSNERKHEHDGTKKVLDLAKRLGVKLNDMYEDDTELSEEDEETLHKLFGE